MPCNDYGTAKFKGVEFEILPVTYSGGRRILTHKYPFSDQHYNEDLGDLPEKFSITGCFHGKDFRDKFQTAKRIWGVKGDGVYFDPTINRSFQCTLKSWSYKLDHKKLNYIEFTLELVEKANDPFPSNILGLIGQINDIIDGVIGTVSDVHVAVSQVVGSVRSATDGLKAGYEYMDGSIRMTIPASGYVDTKIAITDGVAIAESATADTPKNKMAKDNVAAVLAVHEAAVKTAPKAFYKMNSEVRSTGTIVEEAQTQLIAQSSLVYYFEKVSDNADFGELQDFRDRATAIKDDLQTTIERVKTEPLQFVKSNVPSVCQTNKQTIIDAMQKLIEQVDDMIVYTGQATTHTPTYNLDGTHHALVASYELYGDISHASDIIQLSGGVSGSQLSRVNYYQ